MANLDFIWSLSFDYYEIFFGIFGYEVLVKVIESIKILLIGRFCPV